MIFCSKCKAVLDPANPEVREPKICIDCVRDETPGTTRKIIQPNTIGKPKPPEWEPGGSELPKDAKVAVPKTKNAAHQISFGYVRMPVEKEGDTPKVLVEVTIQNYFKEKLLAFGLSKEQLSIWMEDIQNIEAGNIPSE